MFPNESFDFDQEPKLNPMNARMDSNSNQADSEIKERIH